jgi:2'-hydroxyisoflavone reductase
MRLLVIGGTRFLGRHLVEQALQAGHRVTLLNRGRANPGLFPAVDSRIADRNGDLSVVLGADERWDAAIDTCAYLPRQVRALAGRLAGRVGQYQMVSSISAYADFRPGMGEDAPLATIDDPDTETVDGRTYGALKALCEGAAEEGFTGRCLRPRPALIVGPHDPTERFTWWVRRFARAEPGSEGLAPGSPEAPVQFIDVRDAAAWLLRQAEVGTTGAFNLTGPDAAGTMGGLIDALRTTLAPTLRPVWVDEDFLQAEGVAAWSDLPVWLGRDDEASHRIDASRARATGLRCRPWGQTIADTAAWAATTAAPPSPPPGLAPAREAELLARWRAR